MAGLNERLIDKNAVYFQDSSLTASMTSNALQTGAGGQLGSTKIVLRASEDVTLADGKKISVEVASSAESTGTFVAVTKSEVVASGATTYSAGAIITEVVIPRVALEWTKVTIATDEGTPSGKVDAFCSSPTGFSNV